MNVSQEEALYDFLDNALGPFTLEELVSYIRMIDSKRGNWLAEEVTIFINFRKLAFPLEDKRWLSRRAFFESVPFVISPTRMELVNGILIPGHRCVPFANANLLPQEYTFYWQGQPVPFTTTEGPPDEFYPYYSVFGEEYAPQYVARDNAENEEAFNGDPYDDPPEVSIKTLDMRNIYREASFVPGDRFAVRTLDWIEGTFTLEKVNESDWTEEELLAWIEAAEAGFDESFRNLGPGSCTEEQVAFAYWYGAPRMRELPACALEEFLYEQTDRIETTAYGIETRFWYAGREIPDQKALDSGNSRPDKTPLEGIFHKYTLPVSEYVVQSYVRDSLYRGETEVEPIIDRIVPDGAELNDLDWNILYDYIEDVLGEARGYYSPFTDKAVGSIRQRAGELHTAVLALALRLQRGDIDMSWLPRHTFIILSQIQGHTAGVMEDLDLEGGPSEIELDAIDSSLDSMIETYEDIKELIDEALGSFRRNNLAVIRPGKNSGAVTERLIQLSIGGLDVWRRIIVSEDCTLGNLHRVIQNVFGWRDSEPHKFRVDGVLTEDDEAREKFPERELRIRDLEEGKQAELIYEYGTKWTVRLMFLSRHETPGIRPVRCVAGAGMPPPEFIGGPVKFKKVLMALEGGNDMERLDARRKLGPEFIPGDFDIEVCNRNLNGLFF